MTTKRIRTILEEQRAEQAKLNAELAKIADSGMYSADYISTQKRKLNDNYASSKAARSKEVVQFLETYKKSLNGTFDLSDPVLTNFLGLATAMKENIPKAVVNSAISHFKGNNTALIALSSIMQANDIKFTGIDNFIIDANDLNAAIYSARTDLDRNSSLSPLSIALDLIDKVESAEIITEEAETGGAPFGNTIF